jgi:hypothetical protein
MVRQQGRNSMGHSLVNRSSGISAHAYSCIRDEFSCAWLCISNLYYTKCNVKSSINRICNNILTNYLLISSSFRCLQQSSSIQLILHIFSLIFLWFIFPLVGLPLFAVISHSLPSVLCILCKTALYIFWSENFHRRVTRHLAGGNSMGWHQHHGASTRMI